MRRHEPAYDGIRALAVILVVAFHCNVPLSAGGALGVDVFFVLSGFLITRLLVDELVSTKRIRVGHFVYRRFARLGPAAITTVLAVAIFSAFVRVEPAHAVSIRDFVGVTTYSTNWLLAVGGLSTHPASLLAHFWSLAMEEQFYVLWPFLLLLLWRLGGRRAAIAGVISIVAAGCIWRLTAGVLGADRVRLTFGGDMHGPDALALGGLLALLAGEERWSRRFEDGLARWRVGALGLGMLAIMTALALAFPLAVQFTIGEVAAALIIVGAPAIRLLSARPAVAVGRVSYGVYLWHQPILLALIRPLHLYAAVEFSLTISVSLLVAAGSYRFLERPMRQRLLARSRRRPVPQSELRLGFAES